MVMTVRCDHCGAETKRPVTKTIDGRALNFCCNGCLQVYELLQITGPVALPAASPVQPPPSPVPGAETMTVRIGGMTCGNCAATVERSLRKVPGVLAAQVDLGAATALVQFNPQRLQQAEMVKAVHKAGYYVIA